MEPKDVVINIRTTRSMKQAIMKEAEKRGISISAYILERALEPIEGGDSIIYTKEFQNVVYSLCVLKDHFDNLNPEEREILGEYIDIYNKGVKGLWQYLK